MENMSLVNKLVNSSLLALLLIAMVYLSFFVTQRFFGKRVISLTVSTFILLIPVFISLLILNRQLNNPQLFPSKFLTLNNIISELIVSAIMVAAFVGTRLIMQATQNIFRRFILPFALRQALIFRQTYRGYNQMRIQTLSIEDNNYKEKHPLIESLVLPRLIKSYLSWQKVVPIDSTEYIVFYEEGSFTKNPLAIPVELINPNDLVEFRAKALNSTGSVNQKSTLIFRQLLIERRKQSR